MDAGMLIKRLRFQRGMTQAELARRAGTTQSAIARLESGGRSPSMATLTRTLEALGQRATLHVEAIESGVDRSLIESMLEVAPTERLRRLRTAARSLQRMRRDALKGPHA
jgi:transcriptional regulator with XRE-family HTH domain